MENLVLSAFGTRGLFELNTGLKNVITNYRLIKTHFINIPNSNKVVTMIVSVKEKSKKVYSPDFRSLEA